MRQGYGSWTRWIASVRVGMVTVALLQVAGCPHSAADPGGYTLTTRTRGNGAVQRDTMLDTYAAGATVRLTVAADAGWEFDHWEGDLTGNGSPSSVVMDSHRTVVAVFVAVPTSPVLTYTVQGQGSVQFTPSDGLYAEGDSVALRALPGEGWEFVRWERDLSGSENPATIVMSGSRTVTAVFARGTSAHLYFTIQGAGSVQLDPAGGQYDEGTTVRLQAVPAAGVPFVGWQGDLSGSANPATLVMDRDRTVVAVFGVPKPKYQLVCDVQGEGSVRFDPPDGLYEEGTMVTLNPVPATGWSFDHWAGDLSDQANPATIQMTTDRQVIAVFVKAG